MNTPSPFPAVRLVIPDPADMIPPPMELLRVRIGLPANDTSKDVELENAWEITVGFAESYLNRWLRTGFYVEPFTHERGRIISLGGYPLVSVDSITDTDGQAVQAYHIESETGLLHLDGSRFYHMVVVEYEAEAPTDAGLMLALLRLFDYVWTQTFDPDAGSIAAGTIKATSIDGMRVEYETGSTSSAGGAATFQSHGLPASVAFMLNPFARVMA